MKALGKTKNSQFGISSDTELKWDLKEAQKRKITETSHKYLSLYNLPKICTGGFG